MSAPRDAAYAAFDTARADSEAAWARVVHALDDAHALDAAASDRAIAEECERIGVMLGIALAADKAAEHDMAINASIRHLARALQLRRQALEARHG